MRIRFLSSNEHKISEVVDILHPLKFEIVPVPFKIEELQTVDVAALVRDKCIKAFRKIGRPLFVEHTGLEIQCLNGFPGGLTQIFWDTLSADRFAKLFGGRPDSQVVARTTIGYCDGRRVHQFRGDIGGTIPAHPRGDASFQWDCVFVPDGESETFAEMGPMRKNKVSMRRRALDELAKYLVKNRV